MLTYWKRSNKFANKKDIKSLDFTIVSALDSVYSKKSKRTRLPDPQKRNIVKHNQKLK